MMHLLTVCLPPPARKGLLTRGRLLVALLLGSLTAYGQAPTITGFSPARNAVAAPRASNVALTFSQAIAAASAGNVRVFSQQRGGQLVRAGQGTMSGGGTSIVTFDPATDFKPGETVFVTVPPTVQGVGGAAVAPHVHQFTAVVAGTGTGNFTASAINPDPAAGGQPRSVVVGDVDGDGDLDLLTANYNTPGTVSVRLNNGTGNFTAPATNPNPAVGNSPRSVAVGDVDGDGDLDLLAANSLANTVSVRLNDGTGNFTAPATNPDPVVGNYPQGVAVGDVDGDGDLDLLTANLFGNTVSVLLNDGTSTFTAPALNPNPTVGGQPYSVAVGDVDSDGDLDLLTANSLANTVSVRLNDGTGNFTAPATNPDPTVGNGPVSVVVGDVDGDGDLDLLAANNNSGNSGTVSVRLNDGTGNFTAPATNPDPAVDNGPFSVAVGDVDSDGDLDLLTANYGASTMSVRLNDGTGNFTAPVTNPNPRLGLGSVSVAVGDMDGDGDLDLLTANAFVNSVSVRLNGGTGPPLATHPTLTARPVSLSLAPNPAPTGAPLCLTGVPADQPLTLLDATGQRLATLRADPTGAATLSAALAPGLYLLRAPDGRTARLVVE